jgi:hypothetical protein
LSVFLDDSVEQIFSVARPVIWTNNLAIFQQQLRFTGAIRSFAINADVDVTASPAVAGAVGDLGAVRRPDRIAVEARSKREPGLRAARKVVQPDVVLVGWLVTAARLPSGDSSTS